MLQRSLFICLYVIFIVCDIFGGQLLHWSVPAYDHFFVSFTSMSNRESISSQKSVCCVMPCFIFHIQKGYMYIIYMLILPMEILDMLNKNHNCYRNYSSMKSP